MIETLNKKELKTLLHSVQIHMQELSKIKEVFDRRSKAGRKWSELHTLQTKIASLIK